MRTSCELCSRHATARRPSRQHLLMNVYPMAPMPKNDHSIQPAAGSIVEAHYLDYAPLFDLMHGAPCNRHVTAM